MQMDTVPCATSMLGTLEPFMNTTKVELWYLTALLKNIKCPTMSYVLYTYNLGKLKGVKVLPSLRKLWLSEKRFSLLRSTQKVLDPSQIDIFTMNQTRSWDINFTYYLCADTTKNSKMDMSWIAVEKFPIKTMCWFKITLKQAKTKG